MSNKITIVQLNEILLEIRNCIEIAKDDLKDDLNSTEIHLEEAKQLLTDLIGDA